VLRLLALTALLALPHGGGTLERELAGRSSQGRPIQLYAFGPADAHFRILVVGCIHGNECAGTAITRRLLNTAAAPAGVRIYVIQNLNPDGSIRGVRQNGRGVDLNRNFPSQWQPIGTRWSPQNAGPHPSSEPETRIAQRIINRLRPNITIWFHQPQALVRAWGHSIPAARTYARLAHTPYRSIRWPNGTAPNWQNHHHPDAAAFVVELPAGTLPRTAIDRHAHAILTLRRALAR
jgi:murein peptide amidase A